MNRPCSATTHFLEDKIAPSLGASVALNSSQQVTFSGDELKHPHGIHTKSSQRLCAFSDRPPAFSQGRNMLFFRRIHRAPHSYEQALQRRDAFLGRQRSSLYRNLT
eukprot:TRINITY_DN187_c0_g1_i1.p4 TRINITY_DN187_c0_g1~~TRINITY_DN187_c0_g1_i1.p4  ORF type:complete len:106 (+),score=8.55 TRINITY_DN187_c0_g1_i1:1414-1731(+)